MEFKYKKKSILSSIIFGIFFLLLSIWISFWIIRKTILEWNDLPFSKIAFGLSFIFILYGLTYLILGIPIIRQKYYLLNKQFNIEFDTKKCEIRVTDKRNNKSSIFSFEDVKFVELYYSWNTGFTSDLGYSKLILRNNRPPIIITQNNVNQHFIYKIFKNKITINKNRFANNFNLKQLLN